MYLLGQAEHLVAHGLAYAYSAIEHPCVVSVAERLRASGVQIRELEVTSAGVIIIPDALNGVGVISVMAANHETGVVQDLDKALSLKQEFGCRVHVDATQGAGRISLALSDADGVVVSSHKLGGPSGVGALVLQDGEPYPSMFTGGAQERGRRAGTVNTAGVVGFGMACELAQRQREKRVKHWEALRERLVAKLTKIGGNVIGKNSIANTVCVTFPNVESESLVQAMDLRGVCISAGAACSSGSLEASPVLTAMNAPNASGGIRFSMGPETTEEEITRSVHLLESSIEGLRAADILDWIDDD